MNNQNNQSSLSFGFTLQFGREFASLSTAGLMSPTKVRVFFSRFGPMVYGFPLKVLLNFGNTYCSRC